MLDEFHICFQKQKKKRLFLQVQSCWRRQLAKGEAMKRRAFLGEGLRSDVWKFWGFGKLTNNGNQFQAEPPSKLRFVLKIHTFLRQDVDQLLSSLLEGRPDETLRGDTWLQKASMGSGAEFMAEFIM